jgi:hypothetical protein
MSAPEFSEASDELLARAHSTLAAAHAHDSDLLETEALRLFEAVTEHVDAEQRELLRLPPGDARLLERGQRRIVDLVVELAASAAGDPDQCRCDGFADRLVAELILQADAERRHLLT